ncbi:MAG: hypothetical protein C0498_08190 [Anaerolinea sp.]|nr:hypothetical protein [Anaerolinea sp.]
MTEQTYQGTTTYAYDTADRLVGVTAPGGAVTASTYDANGNQASAGTTTYAYDLADRLVRATVGPTTKTYTWSGDGIRRSAVRGSRAQDQTRFLVDRAFALPQVALRARCRRPARPSVHVRPRAPEPDDLEQGPPTGTRPPASAR